MKRIIFAEISGCSEEELDFVLEHSHCAESANSIPIIEDPTNNSVRKMIELSFAIDGGEIPLILPVDLNLMKACSKWFEKDQDMEMFCIVPDEDVIMDQMYFYGVNFNKHHSDILHELTTIIQESLYNGATRLGIGAYKDISITKLIHAETPFKEAKDNE